MEAGVQTDTLSNKNIVVIREPRKAGTKPRAKKQLKSINGATPDIQQRWRMWKGIDERNLLRNLEIEEDIVDRLSDVFGVQQSDVQKAIETFQKGRGTAIVGQNYTKEQLDNRSVAGRIGGNRMSAMQGALESVRAYAGWEGADWGIIDRASRMSGRAIDLDIAPAPRFTMNEIEASQRGRVGRGEMRTIEEGRAFAGGRQGTRSSFGERNINAVLGTMLQRAGISGRAREMAFGGSPTGYSTPVAGSRTASQAMTRAVSGTQTPLSGRGPKFGLSEGMRSGSRMRKTEGYV